MAKIRGKKLTIAQIKIIKGYNPSIDVKEWLYYGEESVNENGDKHNKHISKNSLKYKYIKFINRNTGDIIKVEI